MQTTQQKEHITGKVSQRSIASLHISRQQRSISRRYDGKPLRVPRSLGVIRSQGFSFLFKACSLLLEFVNLSASAGLPAVETTSVQKERPADLQACFVHCCRC